MYTHIRDHVHELLAASGAVTMGAAIRGECGDSWTMLACVDRMVEIGELLEVPNSYYHTGQQRLFIQNKKE